MLQNRISLSQRQYRLLIMNHSREEILSENGGQIVQLLQVGIGLSCLYCVFLISVNLPHDSFENQSHVKLTLNYFGCCNDLTFPKQVGYKLERKIIHIYFGDRNRLEKIVYSVLSNFHRKDRISLSNQLSMSDSEFSIIFKELPSLLMKNCQTHFHFLKMLE